MPSQETDATASDLNQFPLFSWDELHPGDDDEDLPKRVTRPRTYDGAVLRYGGWHRRVTKLQVVHRFFAREEHPAPGARRRLRLPHVIVAITGLTEQYWRGYDLSDVARDLYERADGSLTRMQKGVVVLDEIDKVGLGHAGGAGRDHRLGKQQSLLSLLGGGQEIRFGVQRDDRSLSWMADRALLVGAGVFDGLPPVDPVAPGDLIEWGLIPELVERLGSVIRLAPLEGDRLVEVLRSGLSEAQKMFAAFGYRVVFTDQAVSYASRGVEESEADAGPRSGMAWLRAAAERGLVRLLHARADEGSTWTVTPDDVRIPRPSLPGRPPRGTS